MPSSAGALTQTRIVATWWPLAASWLLMAVELPMVSAVVARLRDPELHLAAYGGVVFPISLIVESPIIMLLAASTALSRDWPTFARLRRYMHVAGGGLTLLHIAVAFTSLFDWLVADVLRAPAVVWEPARVGLQIMTPWTWTIAYRRFHQGVLIRFGHSGAVGVGTVVRLTSNVAVLALAAYAGASGIVAATTAVATGVTCEAIYTGWRVRPVLMTLHAESAATPPPTLPAFLRFYTPLAMTSLLILLMEPIGAALLGRMPRALECLALWPPLFGLVWIGESMGEGYQEVVVTLIDKPNGYLQLRRFAGVLLALAALPLTALSLFPGLGRAWFADLVGMAAPLAVLGRDTLAFAIPLPALAVVRSLFQGVLVHHHQTRGIPESMAIFLVTAASLGALGVWWGAVAGLFVVVPALVVGTALQVAWLAFRSREFRRAMSGERA